MRKHPTTLILKGNISMIIYLYVKQHSITGLKYFGMTTSNPTKYNGSGVHWIRHINKHGKDYIRTIKIYEFSNFEECSYFALKFSKENNIVKSKEWANLIEENGLKTTTLGCVLSKTTKKKISNSLKKYNKETIKSPSKLIGRCLSENHKEKIKLAAKIKKLNPNYIHPLLGREPSNKGKVGNQIAWNKGKKTGPNSNISNEKRSETLKKKYETEIHPRKNITPWNKGKKNPTASTNFNTKRMTCEYCNKSNLNAGNYNRWHGSQCKEATPLPRHK